MSCTIYRYGIEVVGFSADGDGRLLNSMRYNSKFDSCTTNQWFNDGDSTVCYLQDIVHIGTKLRNRLLKLTTILLIGNKIASVAHLKILINSVPKSIHGLVYTDICPDDRQNYGSLNKIMEPNVRTALADFVKDSEGTIEYIRICAEITSSLYSENLSPQERLFRIWRSTFFLRAWRINVQNSLNQHFITQNAYSCIELNAKNLIILIKKFRDAGLKEYFLPTIFNSQPCEGFFRQTRSMGTMNYTRITFSILEMMHLIGRVEMMNDIMYFKLNDVDVRFPRNTLNKDNSNHFELPSDLEIQHTIHRALNIALEDAKKFGIIVTNQDIENCKLANVKIDFNPNNNIDANEEIINLGIIEKNEVHQNQFQNLTGLNEVGHKNNSFVNIGEENAPKFVRKSKIMWSLANSSEKLSSDRLQRVQKRKSARRQLEFVNVSMKDKPIYKVAEIKIGDWCVFRDTHQHIPRTFLLGNVLGFRYINGKTNKEKQYSLDFAPVVHETNLRGVEVLASWYNIDINGKVMSHAVCCFTNIDQYVANLIETAIEKHKNGLIYLSEKNIMDIQRELLHFQH